MSWLKCFQPSWQLGIARTFAVITASNDSSKLELHLMASNVMSFSLSTFCGPVNFAIHDCPHPSFPTFHFSSLFPRVKPTQLPHLHLETNMVSFKGPTLKPRFPALFHLSISRSWLGKDPGSGSPTQRRPEGSAMPRARGRLRSPFPAEFHPPRCGRLVQWRQNHAIRLAVVRRHCRQHTNHR